MVRSLNQLVVLIKGGGEVASAVAHRLARCHFRVCLTEVPQPLAVSRGVTFCEAVYDREKEIEGIVARLVSSREKIPETWEQGCLPVLVDPEASIREWLQPDVLIDATMVKRNRNTHITDAPLVIGMGSGFYASRDVHLVVETNHSNSLGRVIPQGRAEVDTGTPVNIGGYTRERVIWAPQAGRFTSDRSLGDNIAAGEEMGRLGGLPLTAQVGGMLRGLLRSGVRVRQGIKLIEIDPVNDRAVCYIIRDKMRAIAGGVLEAILMTLNV